MKTPSLLNEGMIPAHTPCPFTETKCKNMCIAFHKGVEHKVPFSCAAARAWDLSYRLSHEKPQRSEK